jgi:hypothetical protein
MVFMEQAILRTGDDVFQYTSKAYGCLTIVRHFYISSLFRDRAPFTESMLQFCAESRLSHVKC